MAAYEDKVDAFLGTPSAPQATSYEASVDSFLERRAQQQQGRFNASVLTAAETTPEQAAKQKYLSTVTGVPIDVVRTSEGQVKALAKLRELQTAALSSPVLRDRLANPEFAMLAQNDAQPLSSVEALMRGLGSGVVGDFAGGTISGTGRLLEIAQRNLLNAFSSVFLPKPQAGPMGLPTQQPTAESLNGPLLGADWRKVGEALQQYAKENIDVQGPQANDFSYHVAKGLGQVGGQIALQLGTGGLASALTLYAQGAEAVGSKIDKDQAGQGAKDIATLGGAAITALTEKYALDKILGPMAVPIKNAVAAAVARVGVAAAAEGGQELVENIGHDVMRKIFTNPDAKIDLGEAFYEGGVGATVGGIVRSLVEAGLHVRARGMQREIDQTKREIEQLQKIMQTAAGTQVFELDKPTIAEFVQAAAERSGNAPTSVWVDGRVLADTLAQAGIDDAQLDAALPSVRAQLADAMAANSPVEIPIGELTAGITTTPLEAALLPNLRLKANGLSLNEAKLEQQQAQEFLQQQAERVIQQAADTMRMAAGADTVRQLIKAELDATQRFSSDVNDKGAKLVSQFYTVMADRLKTTPEKLYNDLLQYKIKSEGQGSLEQDVGEINPTTGKPIGRVYEAVPVGETPKKTRRAYKLMKVMKTRPGLVFPLYAKPEDKVAQGFTSGLWYRAENQRPSIGAKQLAERPGIHALSLPVFDQGKANAKGESRVWVEVEMPDINADTQAESDNSPVLTNGMRSGITSRLIGAGESYNYKTNPSASQDAGGWPIAGSMRITRILNDDEVATLLRDNGLEHQLENNMAGIDAEAAARMNREMAAVGDVMRIRQLSEVLSSGTLAELQAALQNYRPGVSADLSPEERAKGEAILTPYLELAAAAKPQFDALVRQIAASLDGRPLLAPLKSLARSVDKLMTETGTAGNPDVNEMRDLLRATVIVNSIDDVPAAVAAITQNFEIVRIKDRFAEPLPSGYRDVLINVRMPNGLQAEVQINVPALSMVKDDAHKLYEMARVMKNGDPRIAELEALQGRIYSEAYSFAQNSRSASVAGAPLNLNAASGNGLEGSRANTGEPSASLNTGTPSTSYSTAPGGGSNIGMGTSNAPIIAGDQLNQAARVVTGRPLFEDIINSLGLTDQELAATAIPWMTGLSDEFAFLPPAPVVQNEDDKIEGHGGDIPNTVAFLYSRRLASGLPVLDIKNPDDRATLARLVAAEALADIRVAGSSLEWYDQTVRTTLALMALKYPEVNTDPRARTAFLLSVAITSQTMNVEDNLRFASQQYEAYRATVDENGIGQFPEVGTGKSLEAMANNFKKVNTLLREMGPENLQRFLVTPYTAKELNSLGFSIDENVNELVLGSAVLGPKIGFGFFSNLNGNFEPVTMDMWFMRTIGRLTGTLPSFDPATFAKQIARFRSGLDERGDNGIFADRFNPELVERARTDDAAAIELARLVFKAHEKDFKDNRAAFDAKTREKSTIVKAADTMIKSLDKPKDIPANGTERQNLRDVVRQTVALVQQQYGQRIPPAALQALIWYPEQELYKSLGVKLRVTSQDYAGAAGKLLESEGFHVDQIAAAIQSAQPGSGEVRPGAGEADTAAAGGQPQAAGGLVPFQGDERIRAFVERNQRFLEQQQQQRDSLNQAPAENKYQRAFLAGRGLSVLSPEERAQYDALADKKTLAQDLAEQAVFLQENAQNRGYATIDDWVAQDLIGFMQAAEEWRSGHPAAALMQGNDWPRTEVPGEYEAQPGQYITVLRLADRPGLGGTNAASAEGLATFLSMVDDYDTAAGSEAQNSTTVYAYRVKVPEGGFGEYTRARNGRLLDGQGDKPSRGEAKWGGFWYAFPPGFEGELLGELPLDSLRAAAQQVGESTNFDFIGTEAGSQAVRNAFTSANLPLQAAARGTYDIASMTTVLNGTADLSTFLHETGHFFLDAIRRMVLSGAATPEVVEMYQGALKGLGVSEDEWNAWHDEYDATGKIPSGMRAAHEKWAETFELYLFTGKAPNVAMRGMFRTFMSWLKRVYTSIEEFTARTGRTLDPDLKAVMDKMLATDQEIAEAEQVSGLLPDMDATAEAQEKMNARSLRDLKWARNAVNRYIAKLQKDADSLRKVVEEEVRAEVEAMPIYRALRWIKKGELTTEAGEEIKATKGHKLNTEAIEQMYPESMLGRPDLSRLKGMTASTGLHPDLVADMIPGWTGNGDQLVRALVDAEPMSSVIEGMTDQRMLERHGELATPEAIAQAALEAVHNEARAKALATELAGQRDMLSARRDTGQTNAAGNRVTVNVLMEAAKTFAANVIGRRKLGDLKKATWAHVQAERRAGRAWEAATAKGDTQGAVQAKQDQMLNNAAVKAGIDAQAQVRKALELFKKITRGTDEKLVERGYDPDIANAARAILAAYGIAPSKGKSATEYLETLQRNDPATYNAVAASVNGALINAKPFNELTFDELEALVDEVQSLWHLARRSRQMEIDGNLLDREDVQEDLKGDLEAKGIPSEMPGDTSAITPREQAIRKLLVFKSAATRVENWTQSMGAMFTKYVFQPVKEAADRYRAAKTDYLKKYRELLKTIEPTLKREEIAAPELGYTFGKDTGGIGMNEVLHAILNTGNDSNKRKLLLGRGWATELEDGTLDTSRWDAFVARMINEGRLTKAHYDFAQGVWDLLESMKPLAQKTHRDVFGRYFAEVTANAFDTPFGSYRGGYVPAIADSRIVSDAATRKVMDDENESMVFAFPATNRGFTKGRVEYNRPLMLDLRTLAQHIDKVLLFSHLEQPIRDVRRVLTAKEVAYGLNRIDPAAFDNVITPWLNRAARQMVETPVAGDAGTMRFFSNLRQRAGLAAMFANVANAAQQITGFSLAAVKVKPSYLLQAAAQMAGSPHEMKQAVADASVFMRERMENETANAERAIADILLKPSAIESAKNWTAKHAYFLQQAIDNSMAPVIWTAAFNQATAEGLSEKDAVRHADSVIRTTQGSTLPEDVSRIEGGNAFVRMFTQFSSYFNMQANMLGQEFAKTSRELGVKKGAGRMLYVAVLGFAVPAWISEAIVQAFRGGPDDEDKDGEYLDDWLMAVFGFGTLRNMTAMIPGVGQLANSLVNSFNSKPYDDRIASSPSISMIESAVAAPHSVYKAMVDDGSRQKAVRDVATLLTLTTGLPANALARPLGYLAGVSDYKINPTSGADMARGLVTGVASPESK